MTVFIVLFRGVGGATQLPTKPLRDALTAAGFENAATYINSGNAIVKTELNIAEAKAKIAALAKKKFGFAKDIILVSRRDWAKLVEGNPFPEAVDQPTTLHAFVLNRRPKPDAVKALTARATLPERFVVNGSILYFHVPLAFSNSKLPPVIDRTLGVTSTARNWNTVLKLMALADKAEA
jgi:uncharacterized protein (DUF1697 family)